MDFITDDNYKIKEGTRIYYTGDMANVEGDFVVAKIESCRFYRFKVILQEEDGESRRFVLTPMNFDSGIGRRFKPMELVSREKLEAIEELHKLTRRRND